MSIAVLIFAASAAIALDQACKAVVTRRLTDGRIHHLAPGCAVRRVQCVRRGPVSVSDQRAAVVWSAALTYVSLLVALRAPVSGWAAGGLGLSLGGAASNLADRFVRGAVVDYVAVGRWPVFNLADTALVGGVALAVGSLL